MTINNELIENVRRIFDLNLYEASIWLYLLSKGVSTAGELSELSNVPRSRAYDVLESLEKKGFVMIKVGKPIQYVAVPPKEVINRAKKRILEMAQQKIKKIENAENTELMEELNNLYERGINNFNPLELSSALKGRNNIYNQIESMIKNAQNNVKIMTNEKELLERLSELKNVIRKAYERGVKIEIKAPIREDNEIIRELKPYVEFKNVDETPARFCVVDDKEALLILTENEISPEYDIGVWMNSKAIGKLLSKF